jgi:hypothetical protein
VDEDASARGGEPVVCGMLDGKALYAASLGEWGPGIERPQPIRHLLVYAGHSYSQLGRLVRRMQVLGELRHAAILDYGPDGLGAKKGLREASREIRVLGGQLTAATSDITADAGRLNASKTLGKEIGTMTRLSYFINELAGISGIVDGGLTHRIEQSRYYANEFQAAIKHLRLVRIGDWQPYDDFVQRYILHLFARIDRIGNRYEALGRRVDRLLFFQQAKLLDGYTASVDATVQEIRQATGDLSKAAHLQVKTLGAIKGLSSDQSGTLGHINTAMGLTNQSAGQQIEATNRQTALLTMAERFAIVFLVYYLGSTFAHWFEDGHVIWLVDKEKYLIGWMFSILGAGAWLVAHLLRHFFNWWREKRASSTPALPVEASD